MNKVIKNLLIIGLILITFGFVVGIAATIAGGGRGVWELFRQGRLSLGPTEFFGELDENSHDFNTNGWEVSSGEISKTKIAGKEITELDFQLGGGNIYLVESEDDSFYIEGRETRDVKINVNNGELFIEAIKDKKNIFELDKDMELYIYIPKDMQFKEINIDLGAALLEALPLTSDNMHISVGAGIGEFTYLETNDLNMSVGAGELIAQANCMKEVDLECAVGSIELILKGKLKDFNYKLESSMGTIQVDHEKYQQFSSEQYINNGGEKDITASCTIGEINLKFAE